MVRGRYIGALLLVLSIVGKAANAAPLDEGEGTTAVQPDDRSYLPPWMRSQTETKTALADGETASIPEFSDTANPDAKIKTQGAKPQQRRRRNQFDWLFGR